MRRKRERMAMEPVSRQTRHISPSISHSVRERKKAQTARMAPMDIHTCAMLIMIVGNKLEVVGGGFGAS